MPVNAKSLTNLNRAGRPLGAKNKKTRAIESMAKQAAKIVIGHAAEIDVASMTPIDIMSEVMRRAFSTGDMQMALRAAEAVAPYTHARKTATPEPVAFPPELDIDPSGRPDVPRPEGGADEPGPAHPIH